MAATTPITASTKYSVSNAEKKLDHGQPEIMRVEDLPPFVQFGMKWSPRKRPLLSVLFLLVGLIWCFLGFAQLTGSLGVGLALYIMFSLVFLERLFSVPDSSKGIMLQQLLTNSGATKKGSKKYKRLLLVVWISVIILMGAFWIFGLIPFASSSSQLLGEHTFIITIVVGLVSTVCFLFVLVLFANTMVYGISRSVWEHRVEIYLARIREILLQVVDNKDIESNGKSVSVNSVFNEISNVQQEAETWARTIGIPLSSATNACAITSFSVSVVSNFLLVGFGPGTAETRITAIAIFSGCSLLFAFLFFKVLKSIANINLLWESLRLQYFNDAKIQHSLILLNWSPERFKDFMDNHIINSQVAFGLKITVDRMRRIASVLGSVFAIVLYFLLREELRLLTGTKGV